MLSPKLRYISRTKPFLSPLFLTNFFTSSSSAHHLSNPSIIRYQFADPSAESKEIASTFRDWFRTSKNPVFDRIFSILNSRSDEDLSTSRKMDLGIEDMGISLTESFVLQANEFIFYLLEEALWMAIGSK